MATAMEDPSRRRRPFPRRLARWLAMAFVVAVAVTIRLRLTVTPQDRLRERPEASIYYPASVVLVANGGWDDNGDSDAGIWKRLAVDASVTEVAAFYKRELGARGLMAGGGTSVIGTVDEIQVCAWHSSEFIFRLSFTTAEDYRRRYSEEPPKPTIYRITMMDTQNVPNLGECIHPID